MRRSKILCTVGPASRDTATLRAMVGAGMDAVRLNFSHGTHDEHRATFASVRSVANELGRPLPILQDLQGPKIRVGDIGAAGLELAEGDEVRLRAGRALGSDGAIPISYDALAADVRAGDRLLLDDGLLRLDVTGTDGDEVRARVVDGGHLSSHKGVNLPGAKLSTPALTDKDREDVALGLELGVDFVALSFVRRGDDIRELRELLRSAGATTPIIAKIEKPEAVEHLHDILDAADGLMVARGDLGVELPPEQLPLLQRHIVADANAAGKIVIIATQMLDSMIRNPRPTRAEVTDVAAAVMQGADTTMLSGETAVGAHPVGAVRMMARIIDEVESGLRAFAAPDEPALIQGIAESASAVGRAAVRAARDLDAACVAVFTGSGRTAALVSDYRPRQDILAFTVREDVYRRMGFYWGVVPIHASEDDFEPDAAADLAREHIRRLDLAKPGDFFVLTLGRPSGPGQQTNLMWVLRV